jgi:mitogen-activated protein kinase kinase 1
MARKPPRLALEIDVNATDSLLFPQKPFTFTNNGTFKEGDLAINKNGMLIKGESQLPSYATPQIPSSKGVTYSLQDFEVIKSLGQGSGGVVRQVRHKPTNQLAALKVVALDVNESTRKHIVTELRILYNSKCVYVVSLFDAYYTEGSVYMALEYMDGGSLADLLTSYGSVPEPILVSITSQATKGLTYLQKTLHIVHRDIKPSNILLNSKGEVKIADFGVSSLLPNTGAKAVTWVGTVTYMSPERIQGKEYSHNTDVWALGLTLVECATGKYPYAQINAQTGQPISFFELLNKVLLTPPPTLPSDCFSAEFCSFVADCMIMDASVRPNPDVLLQHDFIVKNSSSSVDLSKYIQPLPSD